MFTYISETRIVEKLHEGASSSSSADSANLIEASVKKRISCPICMDDEQMVCWIVIILLNSYYTVVLLVQLVRSQPSKHKFLALVIDFAKI